MAVASSKLAGFLVPDSADFTALPCESRNQYRVHVTLVKRDVLQSLMLSLLSVGCSIR